ncbi:MAG: tetratricopeptide repeat protein [Pirellulaceae bacterium]
MAGLAAWRWYVAGDPPDQELRARAVDRGQPAADSPSLTKAKSSAPRTFLPTVDNRTCAACHSDIAQSYASNGMSRTWRRIAPEQLPVSAEWITDHTGDFRYRAVVENGELWQEEVRVSDPSHRQRRQARHIIGSGLHAEAYVGEEHGYCVQLPLGWFTAQRAWRMNPGYELYNHRFDRAIGPGCADCHGGEDTYIAPTFNRFHTPLAEGIRCEECHGPGAQHVAFHSGEASSGSEPVQDSIVHPGKLTPARALDVCLQCHLQGDIVLLRKGHEDFDFEPGDRLVDHRIDFLLKSSANKLLGVSSHGARLLQSKCFTASQGKLTCTTCHDPHAPASAESLASYDRDCQSCHAPDSCSRPLEQGAERAANGCVACHMPRREAREGQHLVVTEHLIQRSPAPLPAATEAERKLPVAPGDSVELVALHEQTALPGWAAGAGYVLVRESMGVATDAMERGAKLLTEYVRQDPHDAEASYWLASAEIALHRGSAAIPRLEALLQADPEWPQARYRLAVAYDQVQQYGPALKQYLSLIERYPDWQEPYPLAVRLLMFQGQSEMAVRLLQQQLQLGDDATAYANLALAGRLTGRAPNDCLVWASKAVAIDPRLPLAFLHRGFLLAETGQVERATRDFQRVLELEPGNEKARIGLESLRRLAP